MLKSLVVAKGDQEVFARVFGPEKDVVQACCSGSDLGVAMGRSRLARWYGWCNGPDINVAAECYETRTQSREGLAQWEEAS